MTTNLLPAMANMDDVAVFDDVVFAFEHQTAGHFELHFRRRTR